jgi:hypothetical protein
MSESQPITPEVKPGDVFTHYKDGKKRYFVMVVAQDSETGEGRVIYKPLYPSDVPAWDRPLKMFLGTVEHEGRSVPRFSRVEVEIKRAPVRRRPPLEEVSSGAGRSRSLFERRTASPR